MDLQKAQNLSEKYISLARESIEYKQFDKAIKYLKVSSSLNYDFEWCYKNDDIEDCIEEMSFALERYDCCANKNRIVFFDDFTIDFRALTQQYLTAIVESGYELLYITRRHLSYNKAVHIFSYLNSCPNARVVTVESNCSLQESQNIYKLVTDFNPTYLLMQLAPDDITAPIAFCALDKSIVRLQINLTDHAFWVGVKCSDYLLEFRQHGCNISESYRGTQHSQELLLPFYPFVVPQEFKGLPFDHRDKVFVFSGGALYKINDGSKLFLRSIERMLASHSNVIFAFAGNGDSRELMSFIKERKLGDRFFYIGERRDINEVVKRCDIYINTAPMGGGLMCQYAVINKKPVIGYLDKSDPIESWLIPGCEFKMSYSDEHSFDAELDKLISDVDYRKAKGKNMYEYTMNQEKFNSLFVKTIEELVSPVKITEYRNVPPTHYPHMMSTTDSAEWAFIKKLGCESFLHFPLISASCYLKRIPVHLKKILSQIKCNNKR